MDVEQARTMIRRARERVARGGLDHVPNGFRSRPSEHYLGGRLEEGWCVCTAPMLSSSFQLLDAAVRLRLDLGLPHVVAVLKARPNKDGSGPEPTPEYLRRYQGIAWSALGVAWVLDAGKHEGQFDPDPGSALQRWDASSVFGKIDERLGPLRGTPLPLEASLPRKASETAESLVFPKVDDAIRQVNPRFGEGEIHAPYGGFWRRPRADGIWRYQTGKQRSFGLEVKLDEDSNNPLCQAVELLGHVDAMVYVRVRRPTAKPIHPLAEKAKASLEQGAPMKYLEVATI